MLGQYDGLGWYDGGEDYDENDITDYETYYVPDNYHYDFTLECWVPNEPISE